MKDYSAGSLLNPQRNPVRAVNGSVSAARRADLLSKKANGDSAVTRNLQAPFLKGLTPEELRAVFAGAEHRTVLANSVITNQDHPAEHLFLLLAGRARYFVLTANGRKVILLWIAPGEIVGSATLMSTPTKYVLSAETVMTSSLLIWDRATIRSLAAQYPKLVETHFLKAFTI